MDKVRQKGFGRRAKRERKERILSFSLRSTEFHRLEFVEPIMKVHLLDEGYAKVPKRRDFNEYPKEKVSGNQIFGIRRYA